MPPYRFALRVRFGDVDHAGIVYYPHFFHYFHTAFEEMFFARACGAVRSYRQVLDELKIGFPAVNVECDFKHPLRFGDSVEVELVPARIGEKSVTFHYVATKVGAEADGPCAEAKITCAVIDMGSFRAVPLPASLREFFQTLV